MFNVFGGDMHVNGTFFSEVKDVEGLHNLAHAEVHRRPSTLAPGRIGKPWFVHQSKETIRPQKTRVPGRRVHTRKISRVVHLNSAQQ